MRVISVRHEWPEKQGFVLDRPSGCQEYVFLHFLTEIELLYDQKTITAPPNSFILFRPSTPQWFCAHEPLVHNWMHLTGEVEPVMRQYGLAPDTLYPHADRQSITAVISEIENEFFARKSYAQALSECKLHELFIKLAREQNSVEETVPIGPSLSEAMKKLRRQMLSELEKDWRVPEMARAVYLSPSQFYLIYKQMYGLSPAQDIIAARIERAKQLLQLETYTNREIAGQLGYRSEYFFIRQFKQAVGMPPKQYARMMQKSRR